MAKSSKRHCSKGKSLPPAKQFDNTMVDDYFEELHPLRNERRHEEMREALQRLDQRKEPSQQLNQ